MSSEPKTITLALLSNLWLQKNASENSSEFSEVLDQILNQSGSSESAGTTPTEPEKQSRLPAVDIEAVLGDIAGQINQIEKDAKTGRKRWNAAVIGDDVIIQSEQLWKSISNQLNDGDSHQLEADKFKRYDLQVDVLEKLQKKGFIKENILPAGKVGTKLKIQLKNGSGFVITGFVMNLQAFDQQQISEFEKRAEQHPILKNLAGYQVSS